MDYDEKTPERHAQAITVQPMPHQLEVWKVQEDWAGVTNTQERRKLQNRLNQIAYS